MLSAGIEAEFHSVKCLVLQMHKQSHTRACMRGWVSNNRCRPAHAKNLTSAYLTCALSTHLSTRRVVFPLTYGWTTPKNVHIRAYCP